MSALEAARMGDQIGHTSAWAGLIAGALVGLAIGAAIVFCVVTGGAGAVLIAAAVAGAVALGAGGALAGMEIGKLFQGSICGVILTGSVDTIIENKSAARALADHVTHGGVMIAQGSDSVFVNGFHLARKSEKAQCSGSITETCHFTFIGGNTVTVASIDDEVPSWLVTTLKWTALIAGGAALILTGIGAGAAVALLGLGGSLVGGFLGGRLGRAIGGIWGERAARVGEIIGSFGGALLGGLGAAKLAEPLGLVEPPVEITETPPTETPPRLPQDMNVDPTPRDALPLNRPVGQSPTQNAQVQADIAEAQSQGATDFRVNQQQVNASGERVGVNRPDLQYTDANGRRVYVEYDTPASQRGPIHEQRILANDPDGIVILKTVP